MTKIVNLKLTNETESWIIDFENGVVSVDNRSGKVATAKVAGTQVSGVDVAIASEMHDDAFSGKYDK